MVQWRRRTKGSPRQIGQAFPVDESTQKKKGLLDRIRGMNKGKSHTGSREHEYLERLKEAVRNNTNPDAKLMNGVLTEDDAEYLQKRGFIEIDPFTDNISLTEEGQVHFLGEKMKEKKRVLKSLTEMEKDMILEKREVEEDG